MPRGVPHGPQRDRLNPCRVPAEYNGMGANEIPVTLEAFAATTPPTGRRCLLCSVEPDVEEQVQRGREAGVTYRVMMLWLGSLGYENANKGRLERHFLEGHIHPAHRTTGATA